MDKRFFLLLVAGCVLMASSGPAQFDSGSDESDGALDIAGGQGTIVFERNGLDPDEDSVFHFTTINVGAGTTVDMTADALGASPVTFLASGDVTIAGSIRLNGEIGKLSASNPGRIPSRGAPGGFDGGISADTNGPNEPTGGQGPGGGRTPSEPNRGGGGGNHAGGATNGGNGGGAGSAGGAYGNVLIQPLMGGSGGGGGSGVGNDAGGGGGAFLVASSGTVTIAGGVQANGGNSGGFYGGCGAGGAIRIVASTITGGGSLSAVGGTTGGFGGNGGTGRIRLESVTNTFTGTVNPVAAISSPRPLFYPESGPVIRLVSVDGVAVAEDPTGSFTMPDVTIDNGGEVTLEIEAASIPVGTVISLTLTSDEGGVQALTSTPLAGTFDDSTATASITIPTGFSTFYMTASW